MATEIDLGIEGLRDYTRVGSGGFGIVYSAFEEAQSRVVAVKVLNGLDEAGRRRFDRERRSMGRMTGHPSIVTLLRSGFTADERPYLVMEYLAGGSLQDRVDRTGPIPWPEAIGLVEPVTEALAFTHERGIIHRDIKPGNILIAETGAPKLTDFGIATVKDAAVTTQLSFSPAYTPPETFTALRHDASGELVDPRDERSDLYALAATLYTLGTGDPPFDHPTQAGLINLVLTAPPPQTGDTRLDRFLATAMAKDPADRHRSARHLGDELRSLQSDLTVTPPTAATTVTAAPPDPLHDRAEPGVIDLRTPDPIASANRQPTPQFTPPTPSATTGSQPLTPRPQPDAGWKPTPPAPATEFERVRAGGSVPWLGSTAVSLGAIVVAVAVVFIGLGLLTARTDDDPVFDGPIDATTSTVALEASTPERGPVAPAVTFEHRVNVHAVVALADGRVASGGSDGTVRIWDPANADAPDLVFRNHGDEISAMAQLSDGRMVTAAADGAIHVWELGGSPIIHSRHEAIALTELADGRVASTGADGSVLLWDPDAPEADGDAYLGHDGAVLAITQLADGRVATGGRGGEVHLWDPTAPGSTLARYTGHEGSVTALAQTASGLIVSGGADDTVQVWDPEDPEVTRATFTGHTEGVRAVVALTDGGVASAGNDDTVQLWDPADPTTPSVTYTGHTENVVDVDEMTDGRIASASWDNTVQVFG